MLATRMLEAASQRGVIGSSQTFSITGVYTSPSASTVTVPSGVAVGDLLILAVTNGTPAAKALPSGFTTLSADVSGAVGYRVMVAGDTSWTLPATDYATLFGVRGSVSTPSIDVSTHLTSTSNGVFPSTPATPTGASDAAIMIFLASEAATSGTPSFTSIVGTGTSGAGACGMAVEWTQLTSNAAFNGDSAISANANTTYPKSSSIILLK